MQKSRIKVANYWLSQPSEATKVKAAYERICKKENEQLESHEGCDCGNCYDCRYAKMFSLPEYEMPLM